MRENYRYQTWGFPSSTVPCPLVSWALTSGAAVSAALLAAGPGTQGAGSAPQERREGAQRARRRRGRRGRKRRPQQAAAEADSHQGAVSRGTLPVQLASPFTTTAARSAGPTTGASAFCCGADPWGGSGRGCPPTPIPSQGGALRGMPLERVSPFLVPRGRGNGSSSASQRSERSRSPPAEGWEDEQWLQWQQRDGGGGVALNSPPRAPPRGSQSRNVTNLLN